MYHQKGVFPGQQFKPARRPWTLLNFLAWATVLLSPLFSFALGVFASGSPLLILTFLGFVGAGRTGNAGLGPEVGGLPCAGGSTQAQSRPRSPWRPGFNLSPPASKSSSSH